MNREKARQRAEELVSKMTIEEACSQLRYDSPAIDRLGIPEYNWWNETLHGVARAGTATSFPQAIGLGATFDTVGHLAKRALMRPLDVPADDDRIADFEQELLDAVNATGIGAAALGGRTTALAVHVETAPCHIAALPLAINMGCSATRRGTYEL